MADDFELHINTVNDPAVDAVAIVPSDTVALNRVPKGIYVGTGGNITFVGIKGTSAITLKNVAPGSILPIRPLFIKATGTTASDIVALF